MASQFLSFLQLGIHHVKGVNYLEIFIQFFRLLAAPQGTDIPWPRETWKQYVPQVSPHG